MARDEILKASIGCAINMIKDRVCTSAIVDNNLLAASWLRGPAASVRASAAACHNEAKQWRYLRCDLTPRLCLKMDYKSSDLPHNRR